MLQSQITTFRQILLVVLPTVINGGYFLLTQLIGTDSGFLVRFDLTAPARILASEY